MRTSECYCFLSGPLISAIWCARAQANTSTPHLSRRKRERTRSKAKPPTLVGTRTGHRQGRSANATHQAQHSRTHESVTKERDIKAPAREALKRRDTTSSGSEHVSSRAGRPRQNEVGGLSTAQGYQGLRARVIKASRVRVRGWFSPHLNHRAPVVQVVEGRP